MKTKKGPCEICGTEIEIQICCNQFDCGCMGLPINPPVCSDECYGKLMNKIHNPEQEVAQFSMKYYFDMLESSFIAGTDLFTKRDIENMNTEQAEKIIKSLSSNNWEINLINRIEDIHGIYNPSPSLL